MNEVTCKKCGWVHFAVSREFAENEVKTFNEYFDTLTLVEQMDNYGGRKSSIEKYEHCGLCGNHYSNFRVALDSDAPIGCTLGPIITFL